MTINDLVGRWGCVEGCDIQLNIFADSSVNINICDVGEYGIRATAKISNDKLIIESNRINATLREGIKYDLRVLDGAFVLDGEEYNTTFLFSDGFADEIEYHKASDDTLLELCENFPVAIEQLAGCYQSKEPFFTDINIFNCGGKMRFALSFDARSSWNPVAVWVDESSIVWMVNDALNRRVCRLYPRDGKLAGWVTQAGRIDSRQDCVFEKISDIPTERNEDAQKIDIPNQSRAQTLRENAEYTSGSGKIQMDFELGGELPQILEAFDYSSYVDGKTGDELAFACLDFMGDNFHHKGDSGMPPYKQRSLAEMLAWCKERGGKINCRGLSMILANLLRYNGIKAQHITCYPYEEPFNDCHVVVDCILPSGKRVMLDPTHRAYLLDKNGEYVSLPGLRQILLAGEEFKFNSTAKYTGIPSGDGDDYELTVDDYREYMSKNSIRYSRDKVNADGRDECDLVVLYPASYPVDAVGYNETTVLTTDEGAFWNL